MAVIYISCPVEHCGDEFEFGMGWDYDDNEEFPVIEKVRNNCGHFELLLLSDQNRIENEAIAKFQDGSGESDYD